MSYCLLIILVNGSWVTFGGFPSKFSKCCFHRCIRSCWLVAFSLGLAVVFLLLTSFIVCHAILDCQSSTESLILSIWFCMYSVCSFLSFSFFLNNSVYHTKTVPFKTIQFSISMQFSFIWPYQVRPLRARVNWEVLAMKGYSTFPKAPALLDPHHQMFYCYIEDTRWFFTPQQRYSRCVVQTKLTGSPGHSLGECYPSAAKQSMYSTAPTDCVRKYI